MKKMVDLMLVLTWVIALSIKYGVSGTIQCIGKEREALLVFKQGVDDGCGLLSSWDEHELDCCHWYGITCHLLTGHVIHLDLGGGRCLQGGIISPSLLELKHLKYLDLSGSYYNLPIPSFIGSFPNLEYLNLSSCLFRSEIPRQLANLSRLHSLDLSDNYLKGEIPRQLANLSRLHSLDLSNNYLHGEIPHQLANLSSLTFLDLSSNDDSSYDYDYDYGQGGRRLLSVKSLGWLSHLLMLREVRLNDVDLSAATEWMQAINPLPFLTLLKMRNCGLPPPLGYMNISTTLTVLDLSINNISGPIPEPISNLKHLTYLDLSSNNFQGNISRRAGHLCSLQTLNLMHNNLTNELSSILHSLLSACADQYSLLYLVLCYNQVWGSIPDTITSFPSLRWLYLDHNKLNGTVTQSLGQLSMLETLSLTSNSLKGTLSEHHFSNLSRLSALFLSDNPQLVVNISANWIPPFQLHSIGMRSCKLGPYFPNWLLNHKSIRSLDISNAGISDTLPLSFSNIFSSDDFFYLNVSHNYIYGVLLPMASNNSLAFIDFSYNHFEGVIPVFATSMGALLLNNNMFTNSTPLLCSKTKVEIHYLDLSNNLLSGNLPDCWNQFDSLDVLKLENNDFNGKLPTSIGKLKTIKELYLRNNSFLGELPRSLQNCTYLVLLDASYNSLTGDIPPWVGSLNHLKILNLRSNQLSGIIPVSLCQLSHLRILDLSVNHISGTIPNCIFNLTAMMNATNMLAFPTSLTERYLHQNDSITIMWKRVEQSFRDSLRLVKSIAISDNQLQGTIPRGLSSLRGLVSLDLARNNLTGTIPSDIGKLTSLDYLDLSSNRLWGKIPTSLADVSSLGTLNLSDNNLTGRIPHGTQLQGFDPSVYEGNRGLCGPPLSKCPGDTDSPRGVGIIKEEEEENERGDIDIGFYISAALGFIVGFWGVCGSLVLKTSWRHAYFRFLGDAKDRLYVIVVVNIAKHWRKP